MPQHTYTRGHPLRQPGAVYPTPLHRRAAETLTSFFAGRPGVEAVLLIASCAHGKAVAQSDLDIAVLMEPVALSQHGPDLERHWEEAYQSDEVYAALRGVGSFTHIDVDLIDGQFEPAPRGWTGGPDAFELEIGNSLAYSVPLWQRDAYLEQVRDRWLPYYSDALRRERLAAALRYCHNDLAHIPPYVERGLYFQAFDRLYHAYRGFLQALFISRRTYPIAYDKWIREQVEERLRLPELYRQLPRLFEIGHFESDEIGLKADVLAGLVASYVEV